MPSVPPHFVGCKLTRIVQKYEASVKAADAVKIEEAMLSKDAMSQAQAEFDKYSNESQSFLPDTHPLLHAIV